MKTFGDTESIVQYLLKSRLNSLNQSKNHKQQNRRVKVLHVNYWSPPLTYLYFMPVLKQWSPEECMFCTDSCPRLRATIATARNLLLVPKLGLLVFCRFSRSSVLRLTPRWSVHTNDTCMLTASSRRQTYHSEDADAT